MIDIGRRIYYETAKKKWKEITGTAVAVSAIFLYIWYSQFIGVMVITDYRWSEQCAGTPEDPCWVEYDFYVTNDTFWYPIDYDPWGRDTPFQFSEELESWRLQRSWGTGWRSIPLDKTCTGTWCGAPGSDSDTKYSIAWREGRNYTIRVLGYKNDMTQDIQVGFNPTVVWGGITIDYNLISFEKDITHAEMIFRFRIDRNYTIDDLDKFKTKLIGSRNFQLKNAKTYVWRNESYIKDVPVYGNVTDSYTCNTYNFSYTVSPRYAWCYANNGSGITLWEGPWEWGSIATRTVYWNETAIIGYNQAEKWRDVWDRFNPLGKTIRENRWYVVKIELDKELVFGESAVDVVPSFGGFDFPWAWWNTTYNYRYQLTGTGDNHTIEAIDTDRAKFNGSCHTNDTSSNIYFYDMDADLNDSYADHELAVGTQSARGALDCEEDGSDYQAEEMWQNDIWVGWHLHNETESDIAGQGYSGSNNGAEIIEAVFGDGLETNDTTWFDTGFNPGNVHAVNFSFTLHARCPSDLADNSFLMGTWDDPGSVLDIRHDTTTIPDTFEYRIDADKCEGTLEVDDDVWHMYTLTYRADTLNITVYQDLAVDCYKDESAPNSPPFDNNLYLGDRADDSAGSGAGAECDIDEFRWYNRTLNYSEITDIYNQDLNLAAQESAPAGGDTCDYSSGDFEIDCSESCTIDTETDVGGNDVIFTGSGEVWAAAEVSNIGNTTYSTGCNLTLASGVNWTHGKEGGGPAQP